MGDEAFALFERLFLPNTVYGENRRCTFHRDGERCITVLSRYNSGPYCWLHDRLSRLRQRGHHPSE